MAIEAGIAAKAAAGLCVVGGGCAGVYYGYHHLTSKNKEGEGQQTTEATSESPTSKYDDALIAFLNKSQHDIIFDVKKVGSTSEEDLDVSKLTLTDASATISAKVTVGTENKSKFKVGSGNNLDSEITELKKHNNDNNWTWSCEFEFKKETNAKQSAIEDATKNKILANDSKGLFGILTKDLSSYTHSTDESGIWTRQALIGVKKDFIKQCAKARRTANQHLTNKQEESLIDNKLSHKAAVITFKDSTVSDAANLVLDDSSKTQFSEWFKDIYGTKEYK